MFVSAGWFPPEPPRQDGGRSSPYFSPYLPPFSQVRGRPLLVAVGW